MNFEYNLCKNALKRESFKAKHGFNMFVLNVDTCLNQYMMFE